jgi:LacI family gluconate utilization system Gnt-I transcriptional repressor
MMPDKTYRVATAARMEDVARRARVSLTTVSRTLRTPDQVAPFTRRRVLRAVSAMGYVQNLVAGSLASKRTNVIAAIVPSIDNPAYGKSLQAAADVLRKNGFHLLLGNHSFVAGEEERLIAAFLGRRPDGFILHGRRHSEAAQRMLRSAGIPIVELGELSGRPLDMVVSYSNCAAAKTVTTYLAKRGYQRIGIACTYMRVSERQYQRWRGYRAALREHGMPYSAKRLVETTFGYRQGAEALLMLLKQDPDIDAVFFTGDVMAVGAELECLRRGWKVPDRIAIAGFDDQEIATEAVPALTTVRVAREEIGRRAAQMVLDRLHGKTVDPKIVDVGFRLIARDSA